MTVSLPYVCPVRSISFGIRPSFLTILSRILQFHVAAVKVIIISTLFRWNPIKVLLHRTIIGSQKPVADAGRITLHPALVIAAQEAVDSRKVFEADMLFATLDTTVRKITLERGKEFLLSDTVGFIHKLPTALIEAFKSTLEEMTEADLLLQVVDGSDPHCREHIEVTKKTIAELGAGHIPMITVFNKADLIEPAPVYPRAGFKEESAAEFRNENVYISAKQPASIEFLAEEIWERLGHTDSVFHQPWPEADARLAADDEKEIPVQMNGRTRAVVRLAVDAAKDEARAAGRDALKDRLDGVQLVKEIYVPGRIINFVVRK